MSNLNWTWSTDSRPILPNASGSCAPGVCNFNGSTYLFFSGPGGGGSIVHGSPTFYKFNPQNPDLLSKLTPNGLPLNDGVYDMPYLTEFNGRLYCAVMYTNGSFPIISWTYPVNLCLYSSSDGINWSTVNPFIIGNNIFTIYSSVSMISYNGYLYFFFIDTDRYVSYMTMDANGNFSAVQQLNMLHTAQTDNHGTCGAPGLTVYGGAITFAYQGSFPGGGDDGCIFLAQGEQNGEAGGLLNVWPTNPNQITNSSSGSPAIVVSPDSEYIFVIHEQGGRAGNMLCTYSSDLSNWTDVKISNIATTRSPGVVYIGDTLYCFHEGASESGSLLYFTGQALNT